jgi:hypothetical protein
MQKDKSGPAVGPQAVVLGTAKQMKMPEVQGCQAASCEGWVQRWMLQLKLPIGIYQQERVLPLALYAATFSRPYKVTTLSPGCRVVGPDVFTVIVPTDSVGPAVMTGVTTCCVTHL